MLAALNTLAQELGATLKILSGSTQGKVKETIKSAIACVIIVGAVKPSCNT